VSSIEEILARLGVTEPLAVWCGDAARAGTGAPWTFESPIDGRKLGEANLASREDARGAITAASAAFPAWRDTPAPVRGHFVRQLGESLRKHKEDLATLVTLEVGKITQEALGEVQEMIDICDYATGLSRQLFGRTIASERRAHRLTELWHPLGPIGVITAFNFPVAVWAWNAAIALVCGDPVVWKPSEKAPLCAMACQALAGRLAREMPDVPAGIVNLVCGGADAGEALSTSPELPLVSATGSVPMGRKVGRAVAERLGRSLLELGGNNAMVVAPSADLALAQRAIVFSAVGTCGQRCTTLRRLIVHDSIAGDLVARLKRSYASLPVGDPRESSTLVGPLIDEAAYDAMRATLDRCAAAGAKVFGGNRVTNRVPGGVYVEPAIVEVDDANVLEQLGEIVRQETFAPILYVMRYTDLSEAVHLHNDVPQGLSSAIFTRDVLEAETFCSAAGSDCGIVNVNIGTSGAEIGGAFGGEKDTGGGRESGSDAWRAYMRRATSTVNFSTDLPLAQGIRFDV